jgi:hypothetical protein
MGRPTICRLDLQLLVKELDKPRSTRLARLCVLAFIAAIAAASFRFHFVF